MEELQDMTACTMQNTPLSHTCMSILGIIEEVQGIPTEAGPESPECLSDTNTRTHRHELSRAPGVVPA